MKTPANRKIRDDLRRVLVTLGDEIGGLERYSGTLFGRADVEFAVKGDDLYATLQRVKETVILHRWYIQNFAVPLSLLLDSSTEEKTQTDERQPYSVQSTALHERVEKLLERLEWEQKELNLGV